MVMINVFRNILLFVLVASAPNIEQNESNNLFPPQWQVGDSWEVEIEQYRRLLPDDLFSHRNPQTQEKETNVVKHNHRVQFRVVSNNKVIDQNECYLVEITAPAAPVPISTRKFSVYLSKNEFMPVKGFVSDAVDKHQQSSDVPQFHDNGEDGKNILVKQKNIVAVLDSMRMFTECFPIEVVNMPTIKENDENIDVKESVGDMWPFEIKVLSTKGKKRIIRVEIILHYSSHRKDKEGKTRIKIIQIWEIGKTWWSEYERYYDDVLDLKAKLVDKSNSTVPHYDEF